MPKVRCPYCHDEFDWAPEMGKGRVECPLCGKAMEVVVKKGMKRAGAEARAKVTTTWGTEGFGSREKRDRYGALKKGDVVGGFRVERLHGSGAMAVVYEATQLSLDRRVALKILPKEFARKQTFVRLFDSETDLLASLNHPNIVTIIDRGRENDTYYFAMEFVEGTTLADLVASGPLDEEFFVQIMEQCAEALVYAHSRGIIHRDIKPANIMLNDQGMVKIADFGIAGLIAEAGADTKGKKRVMGTRGYMAPEQEVHINRTDERSDIFSLGAVMYRVLTNVIPDQLPPQPPGRRNAGVDPRLDTIILKCLEFNSERRYQSAADLRDALQGFHRDITRAHEVCPECKKENPVTQQACLHCGADLSEMFDACPDCGAANRIDVDTCMGCARSLRKLRHQISVRISKTEENARRLAGRNQHAEAIAELRNVLGVKGKAFGRARERAERLIASYGEAQVSHFAERLDLVKALAGEGRLSESLQILEGIPAEFTEPQGVEVLVADVDSRMGKAKDDLEGVRQLIAQRCLDDAQEALASVQEAWADCPELPQVRKLLESGRETQQMVAYEVAEVKRHLEKGELADARRAIEFALTAMPDNPEVKQLELELAHREAVALVRSVVSEGKKAFAEGRFRQAADYWTRACDLLPENDKTRSALRRQVQLAKRKSLEEEVVLLDEAKIVCLRAASGRAGASASKKTAVVVFIVLLVAILAVGGLVLYLALSGSVG